VALTAASWQGVGGSARVALGEAVFEGLVGDVGVGERHASEMVGRVVGAHLVAGHRTFQAGDLLVESRGTGLLVNWIGHHADAR